MDFEKCNVRDCDFNYDGKCSYGGSGETKPDNKKECNSFESYNEMWEGNQ